MRLSPQPEPAEHRRGPRGDTQSAGRPDAGVACDGSNPGTMDRCTRACATCEYPGRATCRCGLRAVRLCRNARRTQSGDRCDRHPVGLATTRQRQLGRWCGPSAAAQRRPGVVWSRVAAPQISASRTRLLALQRTNGGWGQRPALMADAYATGQALCALKTSGLEATSAPWRCSPTSRPGSRTESISSSRPPRPHGRRLR